VSSGTWSHTHAEAATDGLMDDLVYIDMLQMFVAGFAD